MVGAGPAPLYALVEMAVVIIQTKINAPFVVSIKNAKGIS